MRATRLLSALDRLSEPHILVLGDVMLDVYDFCRTADSKPIDSEKSGKRAYTAHDSVMTFGGAGNVATNLAALGVSTHLVGLAGSDGYWQQLRQMGDALGVSHCLIRDSGRVTTVKTRIYIDDEYLLRRDHESPQAVSREVGLTLVAEVAANLDRSDVVILSDYAKGLFTAEVTSAVLQSCREHNVPVIVDFKPAHRDLFRDADLLVPNEVEAEALLPGFRSASSVEEGVRDLHRSLGCRMLAVTLGARGIAGYDGEAFFHVSGHEVEAVDAVGCGDTVRATLAIGMALGLSLEESAALANYAAAISVQKPATATLTCDELRQFIGENGV